MLVQLLNIEYFDFQASHICANQISSGRYLTIDGLIVTFVVVILVTISISDSVVYE